MDSPSIDTYPICAFEVISSEELTQANDMLQMAIFCQTAPPVPSPDHISAAQTGRPAWLSSSHPETNIEQGSEQWKRIRNTCVTGTDIAECAAHFMQVAMPPYPAVRASTRYQRFLKSIFEMGRKKVYGVEPDFTPFVQDMFRAGHWAESQSKRFLNYYLPRRFPHLGPIYNCGPVIQTTANNQRFLSSPDGLLADHVFECKSSRKAPPPPWSLAPSAKHLIQMQWAMMATGYPKALWCFHNNPPMQTVIYRLYEINHCSQLASHLTEIGQVVYDVLVFMQQQQAQGRVFNTAAELGREVGDLLRPLAQRNIVHLHCSSGFAPEGQIEDDTPPTKRAKN